MDDQDATSAKHVIELDYASKSSLSKNNRSLDPQFKSKITFTIFLCLGILLLVFIADILILVTTGNSARNTSSFYYLSIISLNLPALASCVLLFISSIRLIIQHQIAVGIVLILADLALTAMDSLFFFFCMIQMRV